MATLILGVCLLAPQLSFAQSTEWEKGDEIMPLGSGTQEDPYIIAQAANLFWVSMNIHSVGGKNFYFVQTDDIDLQGRNWLPIGFFDATSKTDTPANRTAFYGHYDGRGHKITGLRIDWSKETRYVDKDGNIQNLPLNNSLGLDFPAPYGLFGFLGGEVTNLVIDGARIVQSIPTSNKEYRQDIAVGILAGCAGDEAVKVSNVIVRNSFIRDCGTSATHLTATGILIGGLIGDLHGGTIRGTSYVAKPYDISNIYVNVEIEVINTKLLETRINDKGYQFYVGGVLGRARSVHFASQFPKNVVFSGDINAPYALVGPIFAVARCNSAATSTAAGLQNAFVGDFPDRAATNPFPMSQFTTQYYNDFTLWQYTENGELVPHSITDDYPASGLQENANKTQTFLSQSTFTFEKNPAPHRMSAFQGINRAKYASDLKSTVSTFTHEGYNWDMDNSVNIMQPVEPVIFNLVSNHDYSIVATYETDRPAQSVDGYTMRWYESLDWGMNEITGQAITTGNTSILHYVEGNSDIFVYLYDGEECIESRKVHISEFDVELIDNGFPVPYTLRAEYKVQGESAPFESVDIRVDLLRRKDGSIVRYWSSENKSVMEVQIPLTNYETVVRVTARPIDNPAAQQLVREYIVPNYIQFATSTTSNNPSQTSKEYKQLPNRADIYIMDKNRQRLELDNVNYTWVLVNNDTSDKIFQRGQTTEGSSSTSVYLPISVTGASYYFTASASHEDFISDMEIMEKPINYTGFFVPYDDYTYAKKTYAGATMVNTTQENDPQLSCVTSFIDNYGNPFDELLGLTFNFILKNKHNDTNKNDYKNITDLIEHKVQLIGQGNNFRFTFPYPCLSDLYVLMQVYDQYQQRHISFPVFNQYNLKTVPEIKGSAYKYNVELSAGEDINTPRKVHNVTTGLTFTWKLKEKDSGRDIRIDNELTIDPTDPSGRTVIINKGAGFDRILICEVADYYDNKVEISTDIPGEGLRIVQDASDSYLYHADTGGDTGFTDITWSITDYYYEPFDISHLQKSADGLSITVDDAVTPRVLMLTARKDGREVFSAVPLPTLAYGIALDGDIYKASIDSKTETLPGNLAFAWNINYDGIEEEDTQGSTFDKNDMVHPGFNAVITLRITDAYSTVTPSVRYVVQHKHLDLSQRDDYIVATLDGQAPTDGSWQWYGINGDIVDGQCGYPISCTTPTMRIDESNDHYTNYMAIWTSQDGSYRVTGFYSPGHNVIYVFDRDATIEYGGYSEMVGNYADGHPNNNGRTPHTAVKTMAQAYALLRPGGSTKENIIVVMGYLKDTNFLEPDAEAKNRKPVAAYLPSAPYCKNATITGTFGEITQSGTLFMQGKEHFMGGAIVFDDIILAGEVTQTVKDNKVVITKGESYLYCCLHDLTFEKNVRMKDYDDISANNSGIGDYTAPKFHIIGAFYNHDNSHFIYPEDNQTLGRTTIRIHSGSFGRIIAGGRNDYTGSQYNTVSNNICAHPQWPHRVDVEIDLKHIKDMQDYVPFNEKTYPYDIGLLVGGQTDGSVYTDARLMVTSGTIGRFIAGNISYGRKVGDGYPSDAFYGSTVLTLKGGEIRELFGGTLGRSQESTSVTFTDQCETFFYGRSIINIEGGVVNNNIYGGGAGGVVGFGDEANHTNDTHVPYFTDELEGEFNKVFYGDFDAAKGKLPTMEIHDNDPKLLLNPETGKNSILDLNRTYTEVNVSGGAVNGNIYGGAFGYSFQVKKEKANALAGCVFGNTQVNITGGVVRGNVYGGGAGSEKYYVASTTDEERAKFESLANIFGNTNVEISGGIIEGDVFAGSEGIPGMPKMAIINGQTNLRVQQVRISANTWRTPLINGEIYGGSDVGAIIGNTNVKIQGGVIGNNIFGGSKGITGEGSTITVVKGNTNVEITGGRYFTAADEANISPLRHVLPEERMFNIYGGGNANCVIDGDTHVDITRSLFSSHLNLLEGSKYASFQDCMDDITYRKFSVFGAGRGAMTDVTGNTWVNINIVEGGSVPATKPLDVANEQQFITIAGGGYAGNVYGNTNVSIKGNTFAREAYGGSMYGRIEGFASMEITGGSFHNVYGGGLLGDVMKGTYLTIGTKATEGDRYKAAQDNRNIFIYHDVYGGNDVGGVVGYKRLNQIWHSTIIGDTGTPSDELTYKIRRYANNNTTETPYSYHMVDQDYGVNMKILGGNILGCVYGVGNGNHTGYYVPNQAVSEHHQPGFRRVQFTEGPAYLYQLDPAYPDNVGHHIMESDEIKENWGLYLYRPRTGRVRIHIGGNSENDRVRIGQNVFGGGHSCTPGEFDPTKSVFDDPSRFLGGGTVKINFGSHVSVADAVYMGNSGDIIGKQTVSDGTQQTANSLESDYDYHYYNPETNKYALGFPNTEEGRNRFHAYMRLIDMDAQTTLSFFDDPYPEANPTDPTNPNPATNETTPYPLEFKDFDTENPSEESLKASDIRFGAFYAGGARGSMTYHFGGATDGPCYSYILPEGLTIDTHVVGGSQDATVTFYQFSPDYITFDRDRPLFTYHGGVVYDVNDGGVHGYGGGVVEWHKQDEPEEKRLIGDESPRAERVVVKLDVRCQFDPQEASYTDEFGDTYQTRYGGLIYGGCYNSGITNGSVMIISTGNLLGSHYVSQNNDYRDFMAWSSLRYNVGRVYGGGYGKKTGIRGRTNVILGGEFRGFNVFGGGMRGDVSRGTNVIVKDNALVYNAVYGGSLHGNIGLDPIEGTERQDNIGTYVTVLSGSVDRIYGGSMMGNIYNGTHIRISDEDKIISGEDEIQFGPMDPNTGLFQSHNERLVHKAIGDVDPKEFKRIFVGSIFGGNDVSGTISPNRQSGLNTDIYIAEQSRPNKKNYFESVEDKDNPGCYYGGYPIVGNVYAAGNGNMSDYIAGVTIDTETHRYNGGTIHIANGKKADIDIWELGKMHAPLPDVDFSKITVKGGTIINLYGGGNMCTVNYENIIDISYNDTIARAAFPAARQNPLIWGILRLFHDPQRQEVTDIKGQSMVFTNQIFRVFGGNNLMDMNIQPSWELHSGNIGSLYSGGNFGRMLCYSPYGLELEVNSEDLRIDHVYGGGRVGDIGSPMMYSLYGTTLRILRGYVGDVYGGNDVAGNVYNGTNVMINGAIAGNVYGSGNGNYIYYYDYDGTHTPETMKGRITEEYDERYGGRYFVLPPKEAYPGKLYGTTDEEKILAINSYRPNVEKACLSISGENEENGVYVLGNVYCGGNSSTVFVNPDMMYYDPNDPTETPKNQIEFHLGSYTALGGVFLGSNGEGLANAYNIVNISSLNGIDMTKDNELSSLPGYEDPTMLHYTDRPSLDRSLYPNILSMYMRAAEVTALPSTFSIEEDAVNAYIGNFTIGGNYGSMMLDETINIELPYNLTLMGRVVGGCYNSMVSYGGVQSMGGMPKPLKEGVKDRLNLTIRSKFRPWRLRYFPEYNVVRLVNNRADKDGNFIADEDTEPGGIYYYPEGTGNVYGGCFSSGRTVGNINIDIYSDFLGKCIHDDVGFPRAKVDLDMLSNNIKERLTAFTITGAGYGPHSQLIGDVRIRMLPSVGKDNPNAPASGSGSGSGSNTTLGSGSNTTLGSGSSNILDSGNSNTLDSGSNTTLGPDNSNTNGGASTLSALKSPSVIPESESHYHPSVNEIFAGAHNGVHIGNSTTEIRDGLVFSAIYGGSRSAFKYGSSEVIVGYPKYYVCQQSGTYTLERGDQISLVAQAHKDQSGIISYNSKDYNSFNADRTPVIRQKVSYYKGDIVAANVVEQIIGYSPTEKGAVTPITRLDTSTASNGGNGSTNPAPTTSDIDYYFTLQRENPSLYGATWDDIHINIGDNSNMNYPENPYYGGGAIYGGGRALNSATQLYSGIFTQLSYNADNNPDENPESDKKGYGGNSTIIIGDNPANCVVDPDTGKPLYNDQGPEGEKIRDHISIGTGHYVKVNLKPGQDRIGKYLRQSSGNQNTFTHQASGEPVAGAEYYELKCDGGIYGDGRRTFVEKFRAVDIEGYGYADYTPQSAKLINTFQRMDLLSLRDCCLQLQGATDYATNTVDATLYSVARVGEMRMHSSLRGDLTASNPVEGNLELDQKRSRNYMAFFRSVHYLGAVISNTPMAPKEDDEDPLREGIYRGADGKRVMDASTLPNYGYVPASAPSQEPNAPQAPDTNQDPSGNQSPGGNQDPSGNQDPGISSRAGEGEGNEGSGHGDGNGNGTGNEPGTENEPGSTPSTLTGPVSYYQFKKLRIMDRDKFLAASSDEEKMAYQLAYKKRNLATAPNMIGINNGCNLTVQNVFTTETKGESEGIIRDSYDDNIFYGPIDGVVEVKLLTPAVDEGGGYIYAFNLHTDEEVPAMETSGNFVYPAVVDASTDNYIVDDCYPKTFYSLPSYKHEEAHYWYVTGHNYFYNATLTGYTFNGEKIDFHLNNTDNLLYLFGLDVTKANTIKIASIQWDDHVEDDYLCALTSDLDPDEGFDTRSQYELYLTIDRDTHNTYDNHSFGHAFVARIPNGNNEGSNYAYATDADGNIVYTNNYSDYDGNVANTPTIGVRLRDTDSDNQLPKFYHEHLEKPDNVVIKIEAEDIDDSKTNTYTLRLNIVYLQGPYIAGKINVENCALPGEYIYANTSDVQMEMDESLTVTSKHWYLHPRLKKDNDKEKYTWDYSPEGIVDATKYIMENVIGDVNRLQLPARYYQNGWKVGYSIVVNGQPFPLQEIQNEGEAPSNILTVHNYHRMSTMARNIKEIKQFHKRTYPFDVDETYNAHELNIGFDIDLDLVGGALVYIEDDDDFAAFTRYVNYCNEVRRNPDGTVIYDGRYGGDVAMLVAQVLPGYNPDGYITGFTNKRTIEGYQDDEDVPYLNVKDPTGAQKIHFILTTDVKATNACVPINEFRGILHGNGHSIYFDTTYAGQDFIDVNYGEIHDVGFTSSGGKDVSGDYTSVIRENKGLVTNCFYYNYTLGHPECNDDFSSDEYATLIGWNLYEKPNNSPLEYQGVTDNCYQNTNKSNTLDATRGIRGVRYYENERFHNGLIAYNLNQEYLKARYKSEGNDSRVRESMLEEDPVINQKYLYDYYSDGNYRFGYVQSEEHPEGRRLNENMGIPNYENRLGNEHSMHISDQESVLDLRRWFKVAGTDKIIKRDNQGNIIYDENGEPETTDEGYFPIFLYDAQGALAPHSDFIFFGQLKTLGPEREYYPHSINANNRVYRAGGFYSSDTDYGFYFNRAITATISDLTAIDFTGHNDLVYRNDPSHEDGSSIYAAGWNYYCTNRKTMVSETAYTPMGEDRREDILPTIVSQDKGIKQLIYYPPVLDLPGGENKSFMTNIVSFNVDSNTSLHDHDKITRNLLVYTPQIGEQENMLPEADNERLFKMFHYTRLRKLGDPEDETPQEQIIGHQLIETPVQTSEGEELQFHAANGLFHLVDMQNFNAPIDFYVATVENEYNQTTGRAWYNRLPQYFSHRTWEMDPEVFNISKDAWESITLPFTVNRVIAANSVDYTEKYSRGEISHFYGSDPEKGIILHDYWLRGLVATQKDVYETDDVVARATFARPGEGITSSGEPLFNPIDINGRSAQMTADYTYYNDWFYQTYKNYAYNENHNAYAEPTTFEGYRFLTKNAPYIVAYPSMDYYEFDLSGDFYNSKFETTGCNPQEIIYEFSVDHIDDNNNFEAADKSVRIPVTDNYEAVQHTVVTAADGTLTTHHATFSLIREDDITDNMYVLNDENYVVNVEGEDLTLLIGSAFINCHDFGIKEILPFRTYLTLELPGEPGTAPGNDPSANPGNDPGTRSSDKGKDNSKNTAKKHSGSRGAIEARFIQIAGVDGAEQHYFEEEDPDEEEPEIQQPEDQLQGELKISVEGDVLVIESPQGMELDLYNTLGQQIRHLKVYTGMNRYRGIPSGIYIVASTKVYIKA